jgi:hypothetical protein
MSLYYFDARNNGRLFRDDEGTAIAGGLNAARNEAFTALADYVKEIVPCEQRPPRFNRGRDGAGKPLVKVQTVFEIEVLASEPAEQKRH